MRPSLGRRIWDFPLTRIAVYLLLMGLVAAALALGVGLIVSLTHAPLSSRSLSVPENQFIGEAIFAVSALVALAIMRRADRQTLASAGYRRRGMLTQTLGGFALGAGLLSALIGLIALTGVYQRTGHNPGFHPLLPLAFYLLVGIAEETVFRGYVLQTLEARWGTGVAVVGSGLAFGLVHLINPVPGVTTLQRLAGPLCIAAEATLLAGTYLLTRSLWLPIGLHWAWDFFEGPIFGVPDSGTVDSNTLLRSHLVGPFFMTGGPFGPEGSLFFLIVITLTGLWVLRLAVRRGH